MRIARLLGFCRDRSGASAVEFALLAGPLFLMMLGSLEFGRIYWAQQLLQDTAIAGARCMAVPQSQCAVSNTYNSAKTVTFVKTKASTGGISLTDANISLNRSATCSSISGFSRVTVTHTFESALPGFITALATPMPMTASACFPNGS